MAVFYVYTQNTPQIFEMLERGDIETQFKRVANKRPINNNHIGQILKRQYSNVICLSVWLRLTISSNLYKYNEFLLRWLHFSK